MKSPVLVEDENDLQSSQEIGTNLVEALRIMRSRHCNESRREGLRGITKRRDSLSFHLISANEVALTQGAIDGHMHTAKASCAHAKWT